MYDLFDEDLFADAVYEHFSVLDRNYVDDQCRELLARLQATFEQMFETSFVIVDRETKKPMNINAVVAKRDAAEDFLKIVGEDKYEVAILLTEQ